MFGGFKSTFEDDPFFSMHQKQLRGADEIFSSFFNSSDPFLAVTDGSTGKIGSKGKRRERWEDADGTLDLMRNPFESMNTMMRNMHSMMGNLSQHVSDVQNDPNAHCYTQSSFMSYTNTGKGQQPKVYQATTATKQMPGGLRETRKAVRDSEAGLEKMAIGRHINDRGNVITRQRNIRTGDTDENKDYINIAEEEAPQFENEWQEKAQMCYGNRSNRGIRLDNNRLIGDSRGTRQRNRPALEAAAVPRESRRHIRNK